MDHFLRLFHIFLIIDGQLQFIIFQRHDFELKKAEDWLFLLQAALRIFVFVLVSSDKLRFLVQGVAASYVLVECKNYVTDVNFAEFQDILQVKGLDALLLSIG